MNTRTFIGGFALGCITVALTAGAFTSTTRQDPPEMDPAEMERLWMEAMDRYGAPNEEHDFLARRVGTWKAKTEMFMPGAPPEVGELDAAWQMVMDGRYLAGHFKGEFNGMPFEGAGLSGYDRMTNKHFATWIDSWSTMLITSEGTRDGNTITYSGLMPNIITGRFHESKTVETMVDDDTFAMEMYEANGPGGTMQLTMRITYTRQ